ncbi:PTN_MK_C domain-containing protein [Caerostris extrusa]|uniref:PTN_MK_C domain-containing protein n=1 Tax=Caerostris extrusa TaxID=172846 RepID=A0AAV4Q294_CAEEX|nr:PTN_MK_C domain-containing protein [Caerostris extrusa]
MNGGLIPLEWKQTVENKNKETRVPGMESTLYLGKKASNLDGWSFSTRSIFFCSGLTKSSAGKMKVYLTVCFMLSTFILIEAVGHFHDELFRDSDDQEIVYRVTRGAHSKKKDGECRYKKGPWSECDSSNMQKKTLTLKKGDSSCEQTKVISRKCKKACKYDKGDWSECDVSSNTRARTDSLKPESDSSCDPTRTISKKCKKVCRYSKQAAWSDCDPATGQKTKVLVLKKFRSEVAPQQCEANKKITKPCHKGSGHKGKGRQGKGRIHIDYDEDE